MITDIQNIKSALAPAQRLLGIDLGTKTIGMAVSDPALRVASPISTIKRKKFTADIISLQETIHDYNIGGIIFGWPLNLDGTPSKRCQSTRQFALNLEYHGVSLPMAFFDERLSTVAIDKILVQEADMSRNKRGEVIDKMAAGFILQGALEYIMHTPDRLTKKTFL